MITFNVYRRTFRIRCGTNLGTCFSIDVEGKQYLVTAKHIANGISDRDTVEVFYRNTWYELAVSLVGNAPGDIDITVLAPDRQLSPVFPLPATLGGIAWAQDVYFLGFPYNLFADIGESNGNFPMPYVKKAILSAMTITNGTHRLFLDGINNPGFSGGPVVWTEPGSNDFKVAGVVSSYAQKKEYVYDGDEPTALEYRYNTGIVNAFGIKHATDLVEQNPIGFQLPSRTST